MSKLCCPHCGGLNGYNNQVTYKAYRWTAWDQIDTDHMEYKFIKETTPRCEDCGKSVKNFVEKLKLEG